MPERQPLQEQGDLEWRKEMQREDRFLGRGQPSQECHGLSRTTVQRSLELPWDRWVGFVGRVGGAGSEMSSVKHRPREKQGVGGDWQEDSGGIKRDRQMNMRQ